MTLQTEFDMIVHEFDQPITIFPISDVHYGAMEHLAKQWTDFCRLVEDTPNAYVILGGDLINNSIRTCGFINPFDEIVRPREQKRRMVEFLSPIKDRILCVVAGNHEVRTTKDTDLDITYDIRAKLDIEDLYRENMAFMKVSLGRRGYDNTPIQSYTFGVTHGAGGGIYTGATVNRNERFGNIIEGLDCLIVGHTHKGTVSKPAKIVIDRKNNKVSMSHYTVISMVSWLNYGGYAMRKMLLPAHVADPQRLMLTMDKNHKRIEVVW
jgi:predicted phosphodiesterase